jgi:hypothetical protein
MIPDNQPSAGEPFPFDSLFSNQGEEDGGETDWLSSLRSDSNPVSEQTPPEPKSEAEAEPPPTPEAEKNDDNPEWLQRIRQKQTEDKTGPLIPNADPSDTPDWIKRIKEVPSGNQQDFSTQDDIPSPFNPIETDGPVSPPVTPADDDQEWMRKMTDWQTPPEEAFNLDSEPPAAAHDSSSNPSWLDEPVGAPSGQSEPVSPDNASGLPTWLQDDAPEQTPAEAAASNQALPEWFKTAMSKDVSPSSTAAPEGIPPAEPSSTRETAPEGILPAEPSALEPSSAGEPAPDWITSGTDNAPTAEWSVPSAFLGEDAGQAAAEINPPASEKDFSWLDAFKEPQPAPAENSAGSDSAVSPFQPETTPVEAAGSSQALPEWLSAFSDKDNLPPGEFTPEGILPTDPFLTSETTPNWVTPGVENASTGSESVAPSAFLGEDAGTAPIENTLLPEQYSESFNEASSMPFSAKDLPDWLGETNFEDLDLPAPVLPVTPTIIPGAAMPFKEDSLDWLSAQQEETLPQAQSETAAGPDLQPAQLPGWLQAMRPVESIGMTPAAATAAMQENDNWIEKVGPLAGLRATLPTDAQAVQYRKPPIYSNTLHITEKQNVHATLLESLMSDSGRSHVSSKKARKPSPLPRLIIGILMLVLVAGFLYLGGSETVANTQPSMPGSDATLFANSIESLPQNANVIFAVDYQPGYDGELRTASLALLQRLIEKKINIILVSTTPSGPAIGEDLLLNQPYKEFKAVNLGYLPGGVTSLQQFVIDPRSAAPAGYRESANILYYVGLMDKLAIYPVWQTDAMKNILSLKDGSAAIIVATDSIDVSRAWVEQVKPLAGNQPLLFIASAQAAPMLRPYLLSRQVAGMLTGLNDGLAYQSFLQQSTKGHPGIASAMNMGVIFTLLLVAAGAVTEFLSALLKQIRRKSKEVS